MRYFFTWTVFFLVHGQLAHATTAKEIELIQAAAQGKSSDIRRLVEIERVKVNCSAEDGTTPLTAACDAAEEHAGAVRLLLTLGADPHLQGKDGKKPIEFALNRRHVEIIVELYSTSNDCGICLQSLGPNHSDIVRTCRLGCFCDFKSHSNCWKTYAAPGELAGNVKCPKCKANLHFALPQPTQLVAVAAPTIAAPRLTTPAVPVREAIKIPYVDIQRMLLNEMEVLGEFVSIPGGTFTMGSASGRQSDERPHRVHLTAFQMGKRVVTQKTQIILMKTNPSTFQRQEHCPGEYTEFEVERGQWVGGCPNHALETINWQKAHDLAQAADNRYGSRIGRPKILLPSEARWEAANRGGRIVNGVAEFSQSEYVCGDEPEGLGERLREYVHYSGDPLLTAGQTSRVDSKAANSFGVERGGGVWVWVEDWYAQNYGLSSEAFNLDNPRAVTENPPGPRSGDYRVLRGGPGWYYGLPAYGRSAFRFNAGPGRANDFAGALLAKDS